MKNFQEKLNDAINPFSYEKKLYVKDLIKDPPVGVNVWIKKQDENKEEKEKEEADEKEEAPQDK